MLNTNIVTRCDATRRQWENVENHIERKMLYVILLSAVVAIVIVHSAQNDHSITTMKFNNMYDGLDGIDFWCVCVCVIASSLASVIVEWWLTAHNRMRYVQLKVSFGLITYMHKISSKIVFFYDIHWFHPQLWLKIYSWLCTVSPFSLMPQMKMFYLRKCAISITHSSAQCTHTYTQKKSLDL